MADRIEIREFGSEDLRIIDLGPEDSVCLNDLFYTEEEIREHKTLNPLSPTASIGYVGFSGSAMTYHDPVGNHDLGDMVRIMPKPLPATWKCNGCNAGNLWEEGSCTQCGMPKYDSVDYEWEKNR